MVQTWDFWFWSAMVFMAGITIGYDLRSLIK